ncbi:MAG: hypothetical protein PVF46_01915 [Lysobacterales bacterium]
MKGTVLIGLLAGIVLGALLARSAPLSAQPSPQAACPEAITVFRDASRFSRRKYGAENMSQVHAEYTREGWQFVDMETYIENGDLEGFFLSYTRETACN